MMAFYRCVKCDEGVNTGAEHECKPDYYKKRFANIPLETKRKDLLVHPLINRETIQHATDEEIEEVYYQLFSNFDKAMIEVLGESMFNDEF